MRSEIKVRVPAKVNLALAVGGVDPSGYHELATVFQAISLFDEIDAAPADPGRFDLVFRGEGAAFLPTDDTNLAIRAAQALAQRFDVRDAGVSLVIRKRIPVAGGMAGGSGNAAGVLVACNELWGCQAAPDDLAEVAATLGADVPFLLTGGTAMGVNRGDKILPLEVAGDYHWTLALSHFGLSTPSVFRAFDRQVPEPDDPKVPEGLVEALQRGDVAAVGAALTNDLECAALSLQPELRQTLALGMEAGALGAIVSGSGPTCAFLSATAEDADRLAEGLAIFSGVRAVRTAAGPAPGAQIIA